MGDRLLNALVAIDIWIMFHFFGGKAGETISAAAWNAHITGRFWGWTYLWIDAIFYPLQRDHCFKDWAFRREIYK